MPNQDFVQKWINRKYVCFWQPSLTIKLLTGHRLRIHTSFKCLYFYEITHSSQQRGRPKKGRALWLAQVRPAERLRCEWTGPATVRSCSRHSAKSLSMADICRASPSVFLIFRLLSCLLTNPMLCISKAHLYPTFKPKAFARHSKELMKLVTL